MHVISHVTQRSIKASLFGLLIAVLSGVRPAQAWDETGHSIVVDAAVRRLPADVPDFVRTGVAVKRLRYLASEPDRWRNMRMPPMGQLNSPDHYFDVELVELYELTPATLPPLRYALLSHIAAYKARHPDKDYQHDPAKDPEGKLGWPGFAPYRICELYVQLKSSWRTLNTYEKYRDVATEAELRAGRENIVYLMGIISHYVADVAQPLHTTVHYDGWTGPNPKEYVTRKGYIHRLIDAGVIERARLTADRLPKDVPAMRIDDEKLFRQVVAFIQSSHGRMEEVYALEKRGAFESDSEHFAEGTALVADRLAAAGAMLAAIWDAAYRDAGTDPFRERRLRARRDQPKQNRSR